MNTKANQSYLDFLDNYEKQENSETSVTVSKSEPVKAKQDTPVEAPQQKEETVSSIEEKKISSSPKKEVEDIKNNATQPEIKQEEATKAINIKRKSEPSKEIVKQPDIVSDKKIEEDEFGSDFLQDLLNDITVKSIDDDYIERNCVKQIDNVSFEPNEVSNNNIEAEQDFTSSESVEPTKETNIEENSENLTKEKADNQDTISKIDELLKQSKENSPVKKEENPFSNKPKIDASQEANVEKPKKSYSMFDLLEQSETHYQDEWIEMYEKGQRSKKKNSVSEKIKAGKFRINADHSVEILPDLRTDNKTSEELLSEQWI